MRRSSRSCRTALLLLAFTALCLNAGCGFLADEFTVLDRPPPRHDAAAAADEARQ